MKGGEAPLTCDLHLHTSYSDGTDPPRRVVERAAETGLAAVAITDHDTVAGVAEGKAAARDLGLGFLAGTELSAAWHKAEIHVVGLGIRVDEPALRATLDELQRGRARRIDRIIERLEALGISIARDELASPASGALGRMHIARRIHALGFARTVQEAFDKYIGKARPAFVDKPRLDAAEAIGLIRGAGGLAFVGHPGIGTFKKRLPELLDELPFDGIEVYHTKHTPGQTDAFAKLAGERGLLMAGGSDCHGTAKHDPEMGKVRVPYAHFERIEAALAARQP